MSQLIWLGLTVAPCLSICFLNPCRFLGWCFSISELSSVCTIMFYIKICWSWDLSRKRQQQVKQLPILGRATTTYEEPSTLRVLGHENPRKQRNHRSKAVLVLPWHVSFCTQYRLLCGVEEPKSAWTWVIAQQLFSCEIPHLSLLDTCIPQ